MTSVSLCAFVDLYCFLLMLSAWGLSRVHIAQGTHTLLHDSMSSLTNPSATRAPDVGLGLYRDDPLPLSVSFVLVVSSFLRSCLIIPASIPLLPSLNLLPSRLLLSRGLWSLSPSLSPCVSLSLCLSPYLSLSLSVCLAHSLTHSLSRSLTLTHLLALCFSPSLSLFLSLSPA